MEPKLIKIDRNGSKHYEGYVKCDRCGGTGIYAYCVCNGQIVPNWTDNGVCHKCLGAGKVLAKWIERTPEYEAKLEAKRKEKEAARKAQHDAEKDQINKNWLIKHGWDPEGFTFLWTGNTFEIKDQIKEMGGKFDPILEWHIDHQVEGFEMLKVTNEILEEIYWGYEIKINRSEADQMKKDFVNSLHPEDHNSTYQGQVGDRLKNLHLTLNFKTFSEWQRPDKFRGYYTMTTYIYSFKDQTGNIFTYFTSSPLETLEGEYFKPLEEGKTYIIDGSVKEHKEYKGDKQTVLQRCKVQGIV